MRNAFAFLALLLIGSAAAAQLPDNFTRAEPLARIDTIPPARDIPFPGTIRLRVDATDVQRRIFRVRQTIPVPGAGDFVLLYPEWLPGAHTPRGAVKNVAGLKISAGERRLTWRRDPTDVHAFHVDVPEGVKSIEVEFQYLSATDSDQGRTVMTPELASIQWIANSLYPAGYYVRGIPVQAILTVPKGWQVATSLAAGRRRRHLDHHLPDGALRRCWSIRRLFAGAHFRKWELAPDVTLNVVADRPEELAASEDLIALHRKLVEQAVKLFGARHYDHYDFLLSISENLGDDRPRASPKLGERGQDRLFHRLGERPARPQPASARIRPQLERQVSPRRRRLDARLPDADAEQPALGLRRPDPILGLCARRALRDARPSRRCSTRSPPSPPPTIRPPGRGWQPLIDTTNDPITAQRSPQPWRSWQRSEDYYSEGLLIWLDVDRILRQRSNGRRSMNDFARAFFGMNDRDYGELDLQVRRRRRDPQPDPALRLGRLSEPPARRLYRAGAARGDRARAATGSSIPTFRPTGSRPARRRPRRSTSAIRAASRSAPATAA